MTFKELLVILLVSIVPSGCAFLDAITWPYTDEQCEVVEQNFEKLKVGMTKEEVIPLIGGERGIYVNFYGGQFPGNKPEEYETQQKNIWQVWALCKNPKNRDEWLMIAFDTKKNKVLKIFSGDPEVYLFL